MSIEAIETAIANHDLDALANALEAAGVEVRNIGDESVKFIRGFGAIYHNGSSWIVEGMDYEVWEVPENELIDDLVSLALAAV